MQRVPRIAVLSLTEDLDVSSVGSVRESIDRLVEGGCRRIVLNMEGVSYIDSAGMSMLICEARLMRQLDGLISLINLSDDVFKSMRIIGMADMIPASRAGATNDVPLLSEKAVPAWRKTILVDPKDMAGARARLKELLSEVALSRNDAFDFLLACGEAVGNAVDHTSAEGVMLTVASYPDRIVAEISDRGAGFAPDAAQPSLAASAFAAPALSSRFASSLVGVAARAAHQARESGSEGGIERGRGIKLMGLLTDAVSIGPRPGGGGTVVRLVKMIHVH